MQLLRFLALPLVASSLVAAVPLASPQQTKQQQQQQSPGAPADNNDGSITIRIPKLNIPPGVTKAVGTVLLSALGSAIGGATKDMIMASCKPKPQTPEEAQVAWLESKVAYHRMQNSKLAPIFKLPPVTWARKALRKLKGVPWSFEDECKCVEELSNDKDYYKDVYGPNGFSWDSFDQIHKLRDACKSEKAMQTEKRLRAQLKVARAKNGSPLSMVKEFADKAGRTVGPVANAVGEGLFNGAVAAGAFGLGAAGRLFDPRWAP